LHAAREIIIIFFIHGKQNSSTEEIYQLIINLESWTKNIPLFMWQGDESIKQQQQQRRWFLFLLSGKRSHITGQITTDTGYEFRQSVFKALEDRWGLRYQTSHHRLITRSFHQQTNNLVHESTQHPTSCNHVNTVI
jgi:hypothetical protein